MADNEVAAPSGALPSHPEKKMPAKHKNTRIQKRPLSRRPVYRPSSATPSGPASGQSSTTANGSTRTVYVSAKTPFMAVVRRTLKMLEKPSQRTRSLPLAARMQAVRAGAGAGRGAERRDGDGEGDADTDADAAAEGREGKDDVVLLGTGRAIEKTLQVAAWLQRRGDLRVSLRTGSVGTVDDLVPVERRKAEDGDGDGMGAEEDADLRDAASDGGELPSARVRWLSCMEVGVRMR